MAEDKVQRKRSGDFQSRDLEKEVKIPPVPVCTEEKHEIYDMNAWLFGHKANKKPVELLNELKGQVGSTIEKILELLEQQNREQEKLIENLKKENVELKQCVKRCTCGSSNGYYHSRSNHGFHRSFDKGESFWFSRTPSPFRKVYCYIKRPAQDVVKHPSDQLMAQVKEKLKQNHRVDLQIKPWEEGASCTNTPVLVFCLHSSRIGTDVDLSLKEFNGDRASSIILIVLHHVARHANSITSTDSIMSLTRKERVKLVLDIVFWESDGLYPSPANEETREKLVSFLESSPI